MDNILASQLQDYIASLFGQRQSTESDTDSLQHNRSDLSVDSTNGRKRTTVTFFKKSNLLNLLVPALTLMYKAKPDHLEEPQPVIDEPSPETPVSTEKLSNK